MRVLDPLLFLFGDRGAIERIAATRYAWLVGAILVLSAGIARNYDHLDLLREPEWFIGPFVASLVSIGFIFTWLAGPLKLSLVGPYWKQQGTFLTLAWMTAPCAWLYGIPVEGMTDLITATKWNIAFLAIVALWRVVIMVRAVSVLTGVKAIRALPLVLAPAALEAMVGSFFTALSLVQIMGGVRLPPDTQLLQDASSFTVTASFWVFVASFVVSFMVGGVATSPMNRPAAESSSAAAIQVAIGSLVLWALASLPFHAALRNRDVLKRLIQSDDYPAAVAFASSKTRADFPTHYDLPPASDSWRFPFELLSALPADAPLWLREEWTANAVESLKLRLPDAEKWQAIKAEHPTLIKAVETYAEKLRSDPAAAFEDRHWLREYDELRQPADPPERIHPNKLTPP